MISRLLLTHNNLIQLETSKLISALLKRTTTHHNTPLISLDFATKLLTKCVVPLLEDASVRPHVLRWAETILAIENMHIFIEKIPFYVVNRYR